jgi:predicted nucleic acid-binding protein
MLYFDTSFLAPLILQEATSARVERFISGLPVGELAISHWTRVEFSSLLAQEVRMGGLEAHAAGEAGAQFDSIVEETFAVVLPDANDFDLARKYLAAHETGLRGGDALHLAIASARRAAAIYTLDKTLLKAGKALPLPVSTGIRMTK